MQENTNKAIAYNTIILYIRLGITLVFGLLTTRYALRALGVIDFGLTSVVGSIIVFINIVNTTMLGASNRFMAAAIGKGDAVEINRTFNVNRVIHVVIASITLLIALPIGIYYIKGYLNYDGPINNAIQVFVISIVGSAISFIGVPYNGLMLARERFLVFCLTDVIFSTFKLVMTYLLIYFFEEKVLIYSLVTAFNTAAPVLIYFIYCKTNFPDVVRYKLVKKWEYYKETLSFSLWVGYGALVQVGQTQCAAILVNAFFNTIMNTALSVANYLKSAILMFTENLTKPIAPQITKSYAAGNIERCITLMVIISKISFLVTFFISIPFLLETDYIINIWLGNSPEYAVLFSRLIIIDIVIGSFNRGIAEYIFAGGRIKSYQVITNTFLFFSIVVGYIVLKLGAPAHYLLITYIVFSLLGLIIRQLILHIEYRFDNWILIKKSYIPSLCVIVLSVPVLFIPDFIPPIIRMALAMVYDGVVIFFMGFNKTEINIAISYINTRIRK